MIMLIIHLRKIVSHLILDLSLNLYHTILENQELLDLTPSERTECATILLPIRNEPMQNVRNQLHLMLLGTVISLLLGIVLGQKIKF